MNNYNYETQISAPEAALKIGKILGMRQAKSIGVGYDGFDGSALVAGAVKLGAMFCGCDIYNYGVQNMPIMRSAVRFLRNDYGVYVHRSRAIDKDEISIVIMDGSGIELSSAQVEVLFNYGEAGRAAVSAFGKEKDLSEFKTYYLRHIINSVRSREFKMNFNLTTSHETVSEVLSTVLSEFYDKMKEGCRGNYEFGGEIVDGGDRIILRRSDGTELSEEQTLLLMTYVLLHDSSVRTFILPESISKSAEDAILKQGGNVIRADGGKRQRMEKMIEYGNAEQLMMEFDGVYAAVRILDFLNRQAVSFDSLIDRLPKIFKAEAEIECGEEDISSIIQKIKKNCHGTEDGKGITVRMDNGIAVVVPKGMNGMIKVISEAESIEAAEELSAEMKERVKKLVGAAKPPKI